VLGDGFEMFGVGFYNFLASDSMVAFLAAAISCFI
jgi:hypothetical protein